MGDKTCFFKGDSYCILDLKIAEWVLIGAGALNTASMVTFFYRVAVTGNTYIYLLSEFALYIHCTELLQIVLNLWSGIFTCDCFRAKMLFFLFLMCLNIKLLKCVIACDDLLVPMFTNIGII